MLPNLINNGFNTKNVTLIFPLEKGIIVDRKERF